MVQKFILSTVGIAMFFNVLNSDESQWRARLNELSNEKHIPKEHDEKIKEIRQRAAQLLKDGSIDKRRKISAALNGLYGLYKNREPDPMDYHYLISTDTALGKAAAEVLEDFLRYKSANVSIFTPPELTTESASRFSQGIKNLLIWCEKTIPGYRDSQYEVIFNLTAAFKSLQGYLNIVGMFYADRLVYIFEGSKELLSIPRLPIQVDMEQADKNADKLALLHAGAILRRNQVEKMPEAFFDEDENGDITISDWGILIWNRTKKDIFSKQLVQFPKLIYKSSFKKDFKKSELRQCIDLQETLAEVSAILISNEQLDFSKLKEHGGIQYDNFTNKKTKDGQPIGHFRVTKNNRVSCITSKNGLELRHFGVHDYVNDNP